MFKISLVDATRVLLELVILKFLLCLVFLIHIVGHIILITLNLQSVNIKLLSISQYGVLEKSEDFEVELFEFEV